MRNLLYILCCGMVIGLAYWAYKENYRTQASVRRVSELQYQIAPRTYLYFCAQGRVGLPQPSGPFA